MTAAAESAPAPRRRRTGVLVALSAACVALVAYTLAPTLRIAPDVSPPVVAVEGQCSCNVRATRRLARLHARLNASLTPQRRHLAVDRRRRSFPTCASRRARRQLPRLTLFRAPFRRAFCRSRQAPWRTAAAM